MSASSGTGRSLEFERRPSLLAGLALPRRLLARLASRLSAGRVVVMTPGGQWLEFAGAAPGPDATLVLHRWRALRRLLLDGDIGFAEAYMDGDWSSPDIAALIELGARNDDGLGQVVDGISPLRRLNRLRHRLRANTPAGSRRNIVCHYDLGNAFYAEWLDAGLSYSSGLYAAGVTTLEAAQQAKQARVLALLAAAPGQRVLEIGCGWGGLMERIAACGASVTGVTLSPAQLEHARTRMAGRANTEVRLQDYRAVAGTFDRIVSIEMLEAVGEAFWPTYFATLRDRLAPGGVAVLQGITISEHRFASYRDGVDFIQRYIFPGGMLPTKALLGAHIARAGLRLVHTETFGPSYARTLAEWNRRFQAAWPAIAAMGVPDRFKRMWEYYLCYCEGGFNAGAIDVGLYRIEHAC